MLDTITSFNDGQRSDVIAPPARSCSSTLGGFESDGTAYPTLAEDLEDAVAVVLNCLPSRGLTGGISRKELEHVA